MPATSPAQERLMEAAAHTPGGYGGVPQSVGKEFVGDDLSSGVLAPPVPVVSKGAAGILFKSKDGRILLLRRGNGGDYPGHWAIPGGHIEDGETAEQAARREVLEETGFDFKGELKPLYEADGFTTFVADWNEDRFQVIQSDESDGILWADPELPLPEPMHPGCATMLRVFRADTELAIAELIRDGVLTSPQFYINMWMFDIRITGTDTAYRGAKRDADGKIIRDAEHVYRPPEHYLNDEFLARCNGLTVIMEHPEEGMLNSEEFTNRVIGSVMLPYIKNDEVWGISKIYDQAAATIMTAEQLSTSPGVVLGDVGNENITLDNGDILLIEGKPSLLDHIAICEHGVWDKGGEPTGVISETKEFKMTEEELKAQEAARNDAMRKIIADAMSTAVTPLLARMDAVEAAVANNPAKPLPVADADEEAEKKAKEEKEAKEAKDKKDAEEKERADAEEKEKEEAARKDAEAPMYADCQSKADSVYSLHGERAPAPMEKETLLAYRKRLAGKLQIHSSEFKDVNLNAISDSTILSIAENRIYADAATAARSPVIQGGVLREIKKTGPGGHQISEFVGDSSVWMAPFKAPTSIGRVRNPGASLQ